MQLTVDRNALLAALERVRGIVKKDATTVLGHVHFSALDDEIRLLATDYDVSVEVVVPAVVAVPGFACIGGKALIDVVKVTDLGEIALSRLPNEWAELRAGRSQFKIAGLAAADFPEIKFPGVKWLSVPSAPLRDILEKTAPTMSDDETRMNLNGIFLKIEPVAEGRVRLVGASTDGHRLSVVELNADVAGVESPLSAIVHKKGVPEIRRLLDGESVEVGFAPGVVLFRASGATISVRQIEDNFPDYAKVIPSKTNFNIKVRRDRLAAAVRRMSILGNKTAFCRLEISSGKIALASEAVDQSEGRDEFDVEYEGAPEVIGFNHQYLASLLASLHGESVVLGIIDPQAPILVTSPAEPGALFIIMPMRS